ncbi:MAG: RagB/SusD family nutrient uptake outer membrane protein, partial [Bacteroidales bacterium]
LNTTYRRAGNAAFTGDIPRERIIEAQAREWAFEGPRWFFLKRLGLLVERVQLHGGEKTEMVNDISGRKNIQPFHVRWPIPQVEIDNMGKGNFPQNEGYN